MLTLPTAKFLVPFFVVLGAMLAACGTKAAANAAQPTDPKSTIARQLAHLQAGDVAAVKAGMTERQRERITQEMVDKGKVEAGKYTIDELVDSVETGTDGGNKTAKIKMKNGRTLTTLIEVDGTWLADTIWFK